MEMGAVGVVGRGIDMATDLPGLLVNASYYLEEKAFVSGRDVSKKFKIYQDENLSNYQEVDIETVRNIIVNKMHIEEVWETHGGLPRKK